MAHRMDFSNMERWYKDEVGDDEFNNYDSTNRDHAEERPVSPVDGRKIRLSHSIGAKWYYVQNDLTLDDLNLMCFNGSVIANPNGQSFTLPLPKAKWLSLFKPLSPVPELEGEIMVAQDISRIVRDDCRELPTAMRMTTAPFNYMFADADEAEVSPFDEEDDDPLVPSKIVEDEEDIVPEDMGPSTPPPAARHYHAPTQRPSQALDYTGIDTSGSYARPFLMARVPATTTDIIENHVLALGTNLAVPLIVDEEHEFDKAQATEIFFNGPAEESPSPYHAPLLGGETGYGDVRDDVEDFPGLWPQAGSGLKTISLEDEDTIADIFADVPRVIDTTWCAVVSKPGIERENGIAGLTDRTKARKAKNDGNPADGGVINKQSTVIDLTVDENAFETSSITKYPRARSSFATKATPQDTYIRDNVRHLYAKKVRIASVQDEVLSVCRQSTYGLLTQPDDDDGAVIGATFPNPGLLSQVSDLRGFNGQFNGLMTSEQAERAKKLNVRKVAVYMGHALHLNNLILHKDLRLCPTFKETDYTPTSAPTDSEIGRCISYANKKTDEAADMPRTLFEEALRQEAHRECSMARLEGSVVGVYRYFEGHLTVEEYHQRKMCICWQLCECSKLCTRFADLICPCSNKIETNCR